MADEETATVDQVKEVVKADKAAEEAAAAEEKEEEVVEDDPSKKLEDVTAGDEDTPPDDAEPGGGTSPGEEEEEREEEELDDDIPSDEGPQDPQLLAKAGALGLAEIVSTFSNDDQLRTVLEAMEKGQVSVTTPPETPSAEEDEAKPFELSLSDEEYDPAIVKALKDMNAHYADQDKKRKADMAALQERLDKRERDDQQAAAQEFTERFDGLIKGLGAEYEDALGKGTGAAVKKKNAKAYAAREEVLTHMDVLAEVRQRNGKPPLKLETLFRRSVDTALSEHKQRIASKTRGKKLDKRGKQIIERVPHRKSEPKASGDERAVDKVREILEDRGLRD